MAITDGTRPGVAGVTPALGTPDSSAGIGLDLQAKRDMVTAIYQLISTLQTVFPLASDTTSATATGGAATLPANPVSFLNITVGGQPMKVPLYSP